MYSILWTVDRANKHGIEDDFFTALHTLPLFWETLSPDAELEFEQKTNTYLIFFEPPIPKIRHLLCQGNVCRLNEV